jgi:hypothetical protein
MAEVDLPDELLQRLEAVAAHEQRSLRALLIDVLLERAEDHEDYIEVERMRSEPRVPAIPLEHYLAELEGRAEATE